MKKNSLMEDLRVAELSAMLREKHLTIATAESCTGGLIAHRLTLPRGASDYFTGSIIAYDNRVKEEQLHVEKRVLEAYGAVSRDVAEQMAQNAAREMGTDCSIAVSGIMGPSGGTKEKPVGTVWISTFYRGRVLSRCYRFEGDRTTNIQQTSEQSLLQLMEMLEEKL